MRPNTSVLAPWVGGRQRTKLALCETVLPQVRLASSLLVDHGLWINAGPLLWHEPSAGLLRLTSRELALLIRRSGFRLSTWRTMRGVPYVQGHRGHEVLFWVARRELRSQ